MTEIDTSRKRVQMLSNLSAALSKEMDGWTSIGSDRENRVIRSNSDMLEEIGLVLRALLDRAEKAERERDEAWNDAIEAALSEIEGYAKSCEEDADLEDDEDYATRYKVYAKHVRRAATKVRALKRGSSDD